MQVFDLASRNEAILTKVKDHNTACLPEGIAITADKGYQWAKNTDIMASRKLKNHIMKKAGRNHPLTPWEKKFNKIIGRTKLWKYQKGLKQIN